MELIKPTRRGLLKSLGLIIAAPAIVRIGSLMPVKSFDDELIDIVITGPGNGPWTWKAPASGKIASVQMWGAGGGGGISGGGGSYPHKWVLIDELPPTVTVRVS